MKTLLLSLLLITFFQLSLGQRCGFYRIKYIGKVISPSIQILEIKLPSTNYLNGRYTLDNKRAFRRYKLSDYNFNIDSYSNTSSRSRLPGEWFIKEFKEKTKNFPVILIYLNTYGWPTEKVIFIPFEKMKFIPGKKQDEPKICFDLGKIKL